MNAVDCGALIVLIHHPGNRLKGILLSGGQNSGNPYRGQSFGVTPHILVLAGIGHGPAAEPVVVDIDDAGIDAKLPGILVSPVAVIADIPDVSVLNGDISVYHSIFRQNPL